MAQSLDYNNIFIKYICIFILLSRKLRKLNKINFDDK